MKKHLSTIILLLVFFVGLSVLLYPTISDLWNQHTATRAIASYDEALQTLTPEDYTAALTAAEAYNQALAAQPQAFYDPDIIPGYEYLLDVTGTGIMGYIEIPKINVSLPVYHGTSEGVLQIAVGHLQGTSLPVGGAGTHSVISAHRGLPSARLFTDLDQLEIGDTFSVTVLDRTVTYQVDQITVVLPSEVEGLQITPGQDYMTLMTCTPYGINSHRLLVRGTRTENAPAETTTQVTAEATRTNPYLVAALLAVPVLLVLLLVVLWPRRR